LGDETRAVIEDTDTAPLGQDLDLYACPEVWRELLNSLGLGQESLEQDS